MHLCTPVIHVYTTIYTPNTPLNTLYTPSKRPLNTLNTPYITGVHLKTLQTEYRVNIDIDRANDQLVLRGGPEVVAKAKDALEHLFSGEATVEVTPRLIATIIGKQGSTIERLQEESGASINVSRADNNVVIRGTPEVCVVKYFSLYSVYVQCKSFR